MWVHRHQVCIESDLSGRSREGRLIMSSVYRFRFSMSSDGTKRIQPKRQTLDEAYSPPGLTRISKLYRILQIFLFMFQPIT